MNKKILKLRDGKKVRVLVWDDVLKPKGAVQLIHGSLEHSMRYDELAKVFNKSGYIVFSDDHRGHGETDPETLGHVGFGIEAKDIINDLREINSFYYKKYNLPIVVYGHSWGSYLARALISKKGVHVDKAIISGSGWESPRSTSFGLFLIRLIGLFKKDDQKSKFIQGLTFKNFNKKFAKKSNTGMEWLSNNEESNLKFFNDKLRGDQFTISGFRALIGAANIACKKHTIINTPDIDHLIISGADDPVGKMAKGVTKYSEILKNNNSGKITLKLYKNQRHEIHNDTKKEQLFEDISLFLK